MNNFDKLVDNNKNLFKAVFELSAEEKKQVDFEKKNGFCYRNRNEEGNISFDEIKQAAERYKKNSLCPALGSCSVGQAKANSIAYRRKILGNKNKMPIRKREKKELMDLEEGKAIFWNYHLKDCFSHKDATFIVDQHNKTIIDQLFKYFIWHPSCKLNLTKGICIFGGVGTGKSSLMKAFSEFTKDNHLETRFDFVDTRYINREIEQHGLKALNQYSSEDVCFDDIATRQTKLNSFGTKIMAVDEIIQMRYERFTKPVSRPTHFTTNLDLNINEKGNEEKLLQIYDIRSLDRLKEMCNFVYLGGNSRRK